MATAITDSSSNDGQDCPICLDVFTSPRQLPCLHTFCEPCLQDYITKRARITVQASEEFLCPVCRAVTRPANKGKSVREWASLFPHSPFPLVGKSKVDRQCQVCLNKSEISTNLAKTFCVVCEEFMCDNCTVYHKSMKMSKNHQLMTVEDWESNPENRIKFSEGFGCPEHDNEDIKFYCRNHEAAFCGTCLYHHQKICKDVLELKQSLPGLMKEINPQKIMEQMGKLEDHLKTFMETNEESINILESHVHNISAEIGDIRKKLNVALDSIEKMVKLEGNRIYKECLIRKQEQNHQCQSLVSAIRNSQALLKMVSQYGSDTQTFLVSSKTMKQLNCYKDQIREKFERMDNIKIRLELDRNMKAILSQDAKALVKIICQKERKEFHSSSFIFPFQRRTVELSKVIDIHYPSGLNPDYVSMVQLPEGYMVLADSTNKTCCLYDSSYNLVTSYTLLESPCSMCLIGHNEVAVTLNGLKTIHLLSIIDRSIRVTGVIENRNECYGVDSVSSKEIVVSGPCGRNKCYWSVITRDGNVKLHHEFDCQKTFRATVALDKSKARVYISVSGGNALYCFDVKDGKLYFVYISNDLKFPMGVALDREDNVYVVGHMSNNIHKLSPDGVALQVITTGVPKQPQGISFDQSKDQFMITNGSEMRKKLHYFVHKSYIS